MKADVIKDYFKDNREEIFRLLEYYEFENLKTYAQQIRFSLDGSEDGSANRIKLSSLSYKNYKTGEGGDIISLIQTKNNWGFVETLKQLYIFAGLKPSEKRTATQFPFGGFYKSIIKDCECDTELEPLNEDILNGYELSQFEMFKSDGISYQTQLDFRLRYDENSNRIAIPIYADCGLVGVLGRYNGNKEGVAKYLPIVPYSKSQVLFGYVENYKDLISSDRIYVAESEKAVMQCRDMGIRNVVALGGSSISKTQKKILYTLNPKEIIMCYDEGFLRRQVEDAIHSNLEVVSDENVEKYSKIKIEERVVDLCMKNDFVNVKVGYTWDKEGELKSKQSIFDNGKDMALRLMSQIVWMDK